MYILSAGFPSLSVGFHYESKKQSIEMAESNVNALMGMTQPAFAAIADFNGKLCENAAKLNA